MSLIISQFPELVNYNNQIDLELPAGTEHTQTAYKPQVFDIKTLKYTPDNSWRGDLSPAYFRHNDVLIEFPAPHFGFYNNDSVYKFWSNAGLDDFKDDEDSPLGSNSKFNGIKIVITKDGENSLRLDFHFQFFVCTCADWADNEIDPIWFPHMYPACQTNRDNFSLSYDIELNNGEHETGIVGSQSNDFNKVPLYNQGEENIGFRNSSRFYTCIYASAAVYTTVELLKYEQVSSKFISSTEVDKPFKSIKIELCSGYENVNEAGEKFLYRLQTSDLSYFLLDHTLRRTRIIYGDGMTDVTFPKSTSTLLYYIGTATGTSQDTTQKQYLGLVNETQKELHITSDNLSSMILPELYQFLPEDSTQANIFITQLDGDSGEVYDYQIVKLNGSTRTSLNNSYLTYPGFFSIKDRTISNILSEGEFTISRNTYSIFQFGFAEVYNRKKLPNYGSQYPTTLFTSAPVLTIYMNEDKAKSPITITDKDCFYVNEITGEADTTRPLFKFTENGEFDINKLKIYQQIYQNGDSETVDITDHLTIINVGFDYTVYVKDSFTINPVRSFNECSWPYVTATGLQGNIDFAKINKITVEYNGKTAAEFNITKCITYTIEEVSTQDTLGSIYPGTQTVIPKYSVKLKHTDSYSDIAGTYSGTPEIIHDGFGKSLLKIKFDNDSRSVLALPLIYRNGSDSSDKFIVNYHGYKIYEITLNKAKDNLFFYGATTSYTYKDLNKLTDYFTINYLENSDNCNYILYHIEDKSAIENLNIEIASWRAAKTSYTIRRDIEGNKILNWRMGAADDIVTLDNVDYNKIYIWMKENSEIPTLYRENGLQYMTGYLVSGTDKAFFGAYLYPQPYTDLYDFYNGTISDFNINQTTASFKISGQRECRAAYGYLFASDPTMNTLVSDYKQFNYNSIDYSWNTADASNGLWYYTDITFNANLEDISFGDYYVCPVYTTRTGFAENTIDKNKILQINGEDFTPPYVRKERAGDDFHFITKMFWIDASEQYLYVDFYWNGYLDDLRLYSSVGFASASYLELPKTETADGNYKLKIYFPANTGITAKRFMLSYAKRSDTTIRDSIEIKQFYIELPELRWVQSEYSNIGAKTTSVDIQFYYKGDKTPYEDLLLTSDISTITLPELPTTKSEDGLYTISVNIGENTSFDPKTVYLGISIKGYKEVSYTETKIVQNGKKQTILTLSPNVFNVNNEVSIITAVLEFDDDNDTTPKDGLYVINNLGLVDYELPAELSDNKTYLLSITVPANNTENDRDFYFTVRTNDKQKEATINIHQGSVQLTRLYFTPDNISVDATQNTVNVLLFYNGAGSPYNDLNITNTWGENVQLPKTINQDGFYNLTFNIGTNTQYEARDLTADIETKNGELQSSLYIYQRAAVLPDTIFYWEQSSYSIEFNESYIEATLHYNDFERSIPYDNLIIAPESTYRDFVIPTDYQEDGVYKIRFYIGPNNDYEVKTYTVVLEEKISGNKQSVNISIGSKQNPQLFWVPDNLTVQKDQESIGINYYWNNFANGDPSHYLYMSSDIPGFVPYLPDTVSPSNNYTFIVNLGENTDLAPRNYTITVRTADRLYSSVLHIMQYGTGGDADFTYYFEKQNITAPASGFVPSGYISNKLIGPLTSLSGQFDIISTPYWIKKENIRFDKTGGLLIIDKEDANVFAERTGKIQVLFYSEDGKTYAAEFTVTQVAGQIDATNISPIWRDTWVNIDADYNYFRLVNKNTNEIYFNGQTIQGELAQFKLNNVISDYLNIWSSFGSSLQNGNNFTTSPVEISVSCSKDGSEFDYTLPDTYKFIWDYSYDKHVPGILFNGNIINYYDPRQKMMISSSNRSNYEMITKVETIFANAGKSTIEEYALLPGEMHATFVPAYSGPGDGAVKVKVSCTVQGQTEVKEYVPKCTKANYVLHYVNRYGQVCWMLFAGKQIKSDKITSSKFVQAYDNNYRYNFENVVYQNKVEESWQLTTSYLTDKQSEDLTDLYSSPIVFLEDLNADNTDNIIAVTVETKSVDYKNYKNQGKFFTHTIKVQNAQNKFILL